jgi:tetratricopeptide (TPR) repeat protein
MSATTDGHPNQAERLNLPDASSPVGSTVKMGDLVQVARQAREAALLRNLSLALFCRYEDTDEMGDLEEAIQVMRQAVESTPEDDRNRAPLFGNLGTALARRYERTGKLGDLEEAKQLTRQAFDLTPEDDPDRAGMLSNLGKMGNLEQTMQLRAAVFSKVGKIGGLGERSAIMINKNFKLNAAKLTLCLLGATSVYIARMLKSIAQSIFRIPHTILLTLELIVNLVEFGRDFPELAERPYRELAANVGRRIEHFALSMQGPLMLLGSLVFFSPPGLLIILPAILISSAMYQLYIRLGKVMTVTSFHNTRRVHIILI